MDWFLYDYGIRQERVKVARLQLYFDENINWYFLDL